MSGAKVIYVLAAFFGCSCRHFNFSFSHLSLHSALGWVASGCWEGSCCVCECWGLVVRAVLLVGDESAVSICIVGLFSEASC